MVTMRAVISTPDGKTRQLEVPEDRQSALYGKKIGEVLDGSLLGFSNTKLKITGGSDKDGFPMRNDFPGMRRKRVLLTGGVGFHPARDGIRKKKNIRGNTIGEDISQVNFFVVEGKIEETKGEANEAAKTT
ncbi:MAG: 30S ribosomal protein S6e [Candidatus Thermoplasmatota archaeon]|jgi:small subunit ribosomal protein S6e|nr:30S ribosomal protein S6e [Candidatus Thermoplasmatota archaeon]MCL5789964.1 30S ribosomal protein S6e [Candidatus Thermoplasmatota archaeon]